MSATYDPALSTDKDWVRFQVGDRGIAGDPLSFILADEEINAILSEEQNKYLAAARIGEIIMSHGHGAVSKTVGNLSISYGNDSPESAFRHHLNRLRAKGCELLLKQSGSHIFRVLGTPR